MIDTERFYQTLLQKGMDFFVGVPDSLLKNLCACITEKTPATNNIITANEGNAIAMASGYHVATGKYGVVYMQNSGLGNTVNPLLSLADEDVYRIPMLLIVGWRGEPGKKDEPQHKKQGKLTLPLLETMGIPYEILNETYEAQLQRAEQYMAEKKQAYALVVQKGSFSDYKLTKAAPQYDLTREEALKTILSHITEQEFIVSTTGKTSREIFEIREARKQGHANDFLTVGSMGHTASIALGMSLGTTANVYTIDGDGSFLMHMGGFPVIASVSQKNFKYILINNGAHESVGGQPTVAFGIDVEAILSASGFRHVHRATTAEEIADGMKKLADEEKAALVVYTRQGSRDDLGRPTTTPEENKTAMMQKLSAVRRTE